VIDGGLGRNSFTVGASLDTLQYRLMSGGSSANNRIIGIDPSRERLQFRVPAGQ
jgi:hypothetical protein